MTRTQQRRYQRNYGRMMRQQQGIVRPKMPDLPKAINEDGIKDEKKDSMGDSMEELPESSSGRSKFERSKRDENDDDPGQSITIQFCTLPPVLANNYLPANEFKSKENEHVEKEDDEEEACMLEYGEGIGQTSRDIYEKEEDDSITDIEEEIDPETERRKISHSTLLKHLYQEGVLRSGFVGRIIWAIL
ncbi:hypothetical protein Adt_05138 [Abeliophyllum distichum]|uniref:Uncharacterized protein n=1 Tax=Abeliophyllum distichum TaxID=126358 RepID=A0ABD1V3J4_9LAMI